MKKALLLLLLMGLLGATPALAHKVNLFAYVEGGQIFMESYFPDGRPLKQAIVEIYSPEMQLLQQGVTDDEGQYTCAIPRFVALELRVRASMGHQASFILKRTELESGR